MTTALIRYEAARSALAEAHRVDEVKDIRDKAEAMAAYARQAKDSELIQYATEIKVRAEQRCGELLAVIEKRNGGHAMKARSNNATEVPPTLADMGLTKDESSRYQQLAAMSPEHFEAAVATAKATAGEVTTAFMLREAKRYQAPPKRTQTAERAREQLKHAPSSALIAWARQVLQAVRSQAALTHDEREVLEQLRDALNTRLAN